MNKAINEALWSQFGASIDMLRNAIDLCPAEHWETDRKFWYWSYHCLFWTDYYLSLQPKRFRPPEPYGMSEFDPEGKMPDRVYSKEELLAYLKFCRKKCYTLILTMTEEVAVSRWVSATKDFNVMEVCLYNMRHVQHHAAQLNKILREEIDDAPKWVSVAI